jgi:hypothetical protein
LSVGIGYRVAGGILKSKIRCSGSVFSLVILCPNRYPRHP